MTTTPTSSTAAQAGTGRDSDQLSIRLPEGMRETLKAGAAMHRRTLNAEVVAIIEAGMAAPTTGGSILGPVAGESTTSTPSSAATAPTDNLPHFAEIDATNLVEAGRFGIRVIDFEDNFGINYGGDIIDEGLSSVEADCFLHGFLTGVDHFDAESLVDELAKAEQVIIALMSVMNDEEKEKAAGSLTALGFNPESAARCSERQELLISVRARGVA